jgi:hypothetical protein
MTADTAAALSSKREDIPFPVRVPLALAGLVLLLGFLVMAYLAATTNYGQTVTVPAATDHSAAPQR